MPNTNLVNDLVCAKSLEIFSNNLVFTNNLNTDYQKDFDKEINDTRTGASARIRKPARSTVRTSWTRSAQDHTEESVTLTINQVFGADINIPEAELSLLTLDPEANMAAFSDRYLKNRMVAVANEVDRVLFAQAYVSIANAVGTPGQALNSTAVYGDAMQKLDDNLCPDDERIVIINPNSRNKSIDSLKGLGLQSLSTDAVARGYIGEIQNMKVLMSQNVPNHQVGPLGGTPLVNGGSQVGSSLVTDGWTAAAAQRLRAGDIFTIAGVFAVNYVTKAVTNNLQQFVVNSNTSSDGSGNATISIFPAIVTSGPTQTVNASPADNAAITVLGSANTLYSQNLAFHKDAFAVAFAKLSAPSAGVQSAVKTYKNMTMRYVRSYDINTPQYVDRLDVYLGMVPTYREWATRLYGL